MLKILNLVLFAGMIVMNYLANALPLNNRTTGELSDSFPNLFVPAGMAFSIWGIIYILLLLYCVVQFTGSHQIAISNISLLFGLSCVFNGLWIVAWHYERLPLSLILMLGILISLIYINLFIKGIPLGLVKAAFGVYLGWISIATIANVTALLVSNKWSGYGISEEMWTIIMIAIAAIIISFTIYRLSNPFIGLSVIWALSFIIVKRQGDFRSIAISAGIAILIVAIVTIYGFIGKGSLIKG